MNQRQDLASAVMERDRSRSRMRMVTVTVGAASLATAGVIAYNLPGLAHTTAVSGTTTTPAAFMVVVSVPTTFGLLGVERSTMRKPTESAT